ncbi:tetratricopeptide repeat protein [Virgisporangium aurantiacum]|uniref:tetratricopeptide repeat protein n=1 Tax=Virgisporangium aurantiacum TaxID=175570 RepID=UPI00194F9C7F|nr:tetratricopeptide repeat protein [Virgisporangium aurantiacum]
MNTRIAETRVGGRSRYPGRVALSPAVDIGGSIAEAERLRRDGALPQARQVLGQAVELALAAPGVDQLELCAARRMLAEIMCEMGDPQAAYHVLTTLVPVATQTFGPRHPASVRSLAVLAAVVHELGDFDEAERLYHDVGERIGDRESRAGSLVRVRLALVQRDRGNLAAAREQLGEAYQKHRDAFGTEDPDTVHIAAQLAELHRDAGDSATARRVLTVAYVASCSSLGEGHELTRRLETDLEALEAPMPSAPVDLPEDTQSTRGIKRRHSKKGAGRATTTGPIPTSGHTTGPLPTPPGYTTGPLPTVPGYTTGPIPTPGHTTGPIPTGPLPAPPGHVTGPIPAAPDRGFAAPMGGRGPAAPISGAPGHVTGPIPAPPGRGPAAPMGGRGPAAPISGAPGHVTGPIPGSPGRGPAAPISGPPSGRAGAVPPMSNERAAQGQPQRGPFTASPRASVAAPPRGRETYAAAPPPAGPAAAPAAPPGTYGARAVPAQRRRVVETDQGYGGRRTSRPNSPHSAPPGHSTYGEPLSSARLAALAAQETVVQHVVVDPVATPAQRPEPRRKSGNGVRIAAVILMVLAVLAGIALAAIGVMVAG